VGSRFSHEQRRFFGDKVEITYHGCGNRVVGTDLRLGFWLRLVFALVGLFLWRLGLDSLVFVFVKRGDVVTRRSFLKRCAGVVMGVLGSAYAPLVLRVGSESSPSDDGNYWHGYVADYIRVSREELMLKMCESLERSFWGPMSGNHEVLGGIAPLVAERVDLSDWSVPELRRI
jgi:hypothetical protein